MIAKIGKKYISEGLLKDPNWPEAVPDRLVCRDPFSLRARDLMISEWAGNKGPVLDFGCGTSKASEILSSQGIESSAFDVGDTWVEKIFRTVILHDVIDHIFDDRVKVLQRIKGVLDVDGTIKVRCHPWCSRHGGHQNENKAYAHLVYPERWATEKNLDPVAGYENLFKFSGLKIKDKVVYRRPIENWVLNNFGVKIFSHWPESMWRNYDCPVPLSYLEIEYIDYQLGVS